jgi:hypothetical protein
MSSTISDYTQVRVTKYRPQFTSVSTNIFMSPTVQVSVNAQLNLTSPDFLHNMLIYNRLYTRYRKRCDLNGRNVGHVGRLSVQSAMFNTFFGFNSYLWKKAISVIKYNICLRLYTFIGFHVKYNLFPVLNQSSNVAVQSIRNITKFLPAPLTLKQRTARR